MPKPEIDRPIVFVGMPRSGTTLLFSAFAAHPDLGWFSQYVHRFPRIPLLAALSRLAGRWPATRATTPPSDMSPSLLERVRIMPSETSGEDYGVWTHCCGDALAHDFLTGAHPTPAQRQCLRSTVSSTLYFHGKPRFATKLTGPPRIGYLSDLFEDALFVHIIRDPRAVVESLMRVPFWKETFRLTEPAWTGGLSAAELAALSGSKHYPVALAATEWRIVLERAREESASLPSTRYTEIRYEDFIQRPHDTLDVLFDYGQLRRVSEPHSFIDERLDVRDLSEGWKKRLDALDIHAIESINGALMREFSYFPAEGA